MANNNNSAQQMANAESIETSLRVIASPGDAALNPPPLYPEGANATLRAGINASRRNRNTPIYGSQNVTYSNYLEQYLSSDDYGKEKLLAVVALDDILNHMTTVGYRDENTNLITELIPLIQTTFDSGEPLPDEIIEQVNNYIAIYHSNISGSLYSTLRQRYIEDKLEELRKGRANNARRQANNTRRLQNFRTRIGPYVPRLQARFRSRRARQQHPAEVHRIEVGRERRAREAEERAKKANANRRAAEAREARLKRFQGPSQRRTRRRRNTRRN